MQVPHRWRSINDFITGTPWLGPPSKPERKCSFHRSQALRSLQKNIFTKVTATNLQTWPVPFFQAEENEAAAASERGYTAPCPNEALSESLQIAPHGSSEAPSAEPVARGDALETCEASETSLEPALESKGFRNGLREGLREDVAVERHGEVAGESGLVGARQNEQQGASTVDIEVAERNRKPQSEPILGVEAESNVSGPAGALRASTKKGASNGADGEALADQERYGRLDPFAV
jgi:hypothetical protein